MNLVSMLLKLLTGDTLKRLSGLLGISESQTDAAVKAALPALLSAFGSLASTPAGAQKLAGAVESADEGILGNLASMLGGQGAALSNQGGSLLSSLLTGGTLGSLSSALSKFTGLGSSSTTTLLGTLAPLALGMLKKETKSSGFDPGALTRLFADQRENIASAVPSGLGNLLGDIPGIGDFAGAAQGLHSAAATTAKRAALAGSQMAAAAPAQGASAMKWVVPLVIALAAGWLLWNYVLKPGSQQVVANKPVPSTVQRGPSTVEVSASKLSEDIVRQVSQARTGITDTFADTTNLLKGITDVESARAAIPQLTELNDKFASLKETTHAIPTEQRRGIMDIFTRSRGTLIALLDKVMLIPGVSEILGPHVEKLKATLSAFDE